MRARERCFVSFLQNSAAIMRAGRLNLSSPPRTSIQHHVQPSPKLEVLQDPELLQRSLVHLAPASSLLGLGRHLFGGGALDIAVVGASVAQAGGCLDQPAKRCMEYRGVDRLYNPVPPHQHRVLIKGFLVRFLEAINRTWPAAHRIHNGAADATPADLLAECLFSHIPRRPHLVVLEFGSMAKSTTPEAVEAIVRALLDVPSPPAIVFLSVREWAHRRDPRNLTLWGQYERTAWHRMENYLLRLCQHYRVSCLSYFEALAPLMYSSPPRLTLLDVASDGLHPSTGRLGVDLLAAMLTHWLEHALASVLTSGLLRPSATQATFAQMMSPPLPPSPPPPPAHDWGRLPPPLYPMAAK